MQLKINPGTKNWREPHFTMGVNVEGNNGRKRKMQEAHKRKMQEETLNGSCECVTQDEAGQERPEHEAACTIFSPVHFSKLFPTTVQPLFTKSTFQPLTLLPSACQCQSGGIVGGKMVAGDGAREVPSCWWQDRVAAQVPRSAKRRRRSVFGGSFF